MVNSSLIGAARVPPPRLTWYNTEYFYYVPRQVATIVETMIDKIEAGRVEKVSQETPHSPDRAPVARFNQPDLRWPLTYRNKAWLVKRHNVLVQLNRNVTFNVNCRYVLTTSITMSIPTLGM